MSDPLKPVPGKIAALLRPETINLNLPPTDKATALRVVAELLRPTGCVADFDLFCREVLERERVSNTALDADVAIPHARTEQCSEIIIAVGRCPTGIDFETSDHRIVRLVFLIGTPKAMVTEYLRVVGNLARLLRQDQLRRCLLEAPDAASFIKLIETAEV
jgi:mannitol/fructose-specific phosphotransferase system IIA component (Ntr-type)